MFNLELLPTITDDLADMSPKQAVLYHNTFMKNALIRSLNNVYHLASHVANNPANLLHYLEYVDIVNTMLELHMETDNMFFKSLSGKSKVYKVPVANGVAALEKDLRCLHATIANIKAGKQYQPDVIRTALEGMKGNILEVIHQQSLFFDAPAIPNDVSEEELAELLTDVLCWLLTRCDLSLLAPFCASHHDKATSKSWPGMTPEGLSAMPEFLRARAGVWELTPFDPITGKERPSL